MDDRFSLEEGAKVWNPKYISELVLVKPNVFVIMSVHKKPNWWIRMWVKLLLGFEWRDKVNDDN